MAELSDVEARLRWLETEVERLKRALEALRNRLGPLEQDAKKPLILGSGGGGSIRLVKAGPTGVPGREDLTLGMGTAFLYTIRNNPIEAVEEITVHHYGQVPVEAEAFFEVARVEGKWLTVSEDCPPES